MKLTLVRDTFTQKSTIGNLLVNGVFFCYTLEPVYREIIGEPVENWKIKGVTAIPEGVYNIIMAYSPKFGRQMPHLENVEGFEYIMIHPLNKPEDTLGCIGAGAIKDVDAIWKSKPVCHELNEEIMNALNKAEAVTIEITGRP